jgi:hypothetical protein
MLGVLHNLDIIFLLDGYTEKNKHVEGLFHQYFEGLVKDIQIVVSVVSDIRRINV